MKKLFLLTLISIFLFSCGIYDDEDFYKASDRLKRDCWQKDLEEKLGDEDAKTWIKDSFGNKIVYDENCDKKIETKE